MAPFKFRICLNGCPARGTLSEEILSRILLAGGEEGCVRNVCRKVCRGYVGRYVGRYVGKVCRSGVPRVCRRVCRKSAADGCAQGMSELRVAGLLRGPSPRGSLRTLAPPRTEPSHNALHHADRALSRAENGAQGMSEVCRKCVGHVDFGSHLRALSQEWSLEP